jgi:hypothetical protein
MKDPPQFLHGDLNAFHLMGMPQYTTLKIRNNNTNLNDID